MSVPQLWRKIPEHYRLLGTQCSSCSELFFPGREICRQCHSDEMKPYQFNGDGTLITFTVIRTGHDPPSESGEIPARMVPYILGIIQLEEGPMLTTEIVECDLNEVKIGMPLTSVFRRLLTKGEQGVIHYGYKFRPA